MRKRSFFGLSGKQMLEDKILVFRFNCGSKKALRRIYEKYKNDLLGLAVALLNDVSLAEDVVHDVFVTFAKSAGAFNLTGSLKGYLSICAANRARDRNRSSCQSGSAPEAADEISTDTVDPERLAIGNEESQQLVDFLSKLQYDQREVIVLHLLHGLKFRQIAESQSSSINTIQSRYRYGLDKLRSMLDGEVRT
jgi:RNA polymerase sigma-70 factor (ECF subfamily)